MTDWKLNKEKPPVVATTGGQSKTVEAIDNHLIANPCSNDNRIVAFRAPNGEVWRYAGKRGRVLQMLATRQQGVTQWDTLPWHTRLGSSVHAMRCDGLSIATEIEGRYRHARYRLETPGSLIIQGENREAAA